MRKSEEMMHDLENYFKIRFENKIAIRPRREDCHLAAATRMLAKRHELEDVSKEVANCQVWYKSKMDDIFAKREMVDERERGLKKSLLKFDHFLRENNSKRHRGLTKIAQELKLHESKDSEIKKLNEELDALTNTKNLIQQAVDTNAPFLHYMQAVVESTGEYDTINEILGRYDVLSVTGEYLKDRDARDDAAIQAEQRSMIKCSDNHCYQVLQLNNRMSELQARHGRAQNDVISSENNWTRIKHTAAKKTLLVGQIKMATHNLYQLCNRYHRDRLLDQEEMVLYTDASDQLKAINDVLSDMVAVHEQCTRSLKHQLPKNDATPKRKAYISDN